MYIFWKDQHSKSSDHPSSHIVTIFFLVMRTFKIYFLSNSQICNTVLLTAVTISLLAYVSEGRNLKCVHRAIFPLEALEEHLFPCLLQFLVTACIPWLTAPPHSDFCLLPTSLSLVFSLLPPFPEDPCDYIGPTQVIQHNLSTSASLS